MKRLFCSAASLLLLSSAVNADSSFDYSGMFLRLQTSTTKSPLSGDELPINSTGLSLQFELPGQFIVGSSIAKTHFFERWEDEELNYIGKIEGDSLSVSLGIERYFVLSPSIDLIPGYYYNVTETRGWASFQSTTAPVYAKEWQSSSTNNQSVQLVMRTYPLSSDLLEVNAGLTYLMPESADSDVAFGLRSSVKMGDHVRLGIGYNKQLQAPFANYSFNANYYF